MRHMLPCSGDTWKEPQTAEKVLFFFFQRDTKQFLSRQPKHCFLLLLLLLLTGVELLYKTVLVSSVQQSE